ncbi:MAG: hypothetical protein MHPSP_003237, partial [Paramarteilia canceri]
MQCDIECSLEQTLEEIREMLIKTYPEIENSTKTSGTEGDKKSKNSKDSIMNFRCLARKSNTWLDHSNTLTVYSGLL